jgi:hypothetical protein
MKKIILLPTKMGETTYCGFNLSSTPYLFLQEIQMKGLSHNLEVCENKEPNVH